MQDGTAESADQAPLALSGLSDRERKRLRLLAWRYRTRKATKLLPAMSGVGDLRMRHDIQLSWARCSSSRARVGPLSPGAELHPAESVRAGIQHLGRLATTVRNEHGNDCGLCAVCQVAFPCELAVLAEHNTTLR